MTSGEYYKEFTIYIANTLRRFRERPRKWKRFLRWLKSSKSRGSARQNWK